MGAQPFGKTRIIRQEKVAYNISCQLPRRFTLVAQMVASILETEAPQRQPLIRITRRRLRRRRRGARNRGIINRGALRQEVTSKPRISKHSVVTSSKHGETRA